MSANSEELLTSADSKWRWGAVVELNNTTAELQEDELIDSPDLISQSIIKKRKTKPVGDQLVATKRKMKHLGDWKMKIKPVPEDEPESAWSALPAEWKCQWDGCTDCPKDNSVLHHLTQHLQSAEQQVCVRRCC